jgi:hypothetical protein
MPHEMIDFDRFMIDIDYIKRGFREREHK